LKQKLESEINLCPRPRSAIGPVLVQDFDAITSSFGYDALQALQAHYTDTWSHGNYPREVPSTKANFIDAIQARADIIYPERLSPQSRFTKAILSSSSGLPNEECRGELREDSRRSEEYRDSKGGPNGWMIFGSSGAAPSRWL
jgi:hypothetical protein